MTNTYAITPEQPARFVNFAKILLAAKHTGTARILTSQPPSRNLKLVNGRNVSGRNVLGTLGLQLRRPAPGRPPALARLKANRFSVTRTSGAISRAAGTSELQAVDVDELKLPYGVPRYVNAATLKQMLKARRSDVLLKRTGDAWEICENSLRIDLLDDSVEFRLGAVQIYS